MGDTMKIRCTGPRSRALVLSAAVALFTVFSTPAIHAQFVASTLPKHSADKYPGPVLVTLFEGRLDTDNAKAGDAISLKVKNTLKMKGTKIPGGSQVTGTIVSVQSKKDGSGTSALDIKLDKVVLKGGKEMPITGLIVAIGHVTLGGGNGYQDVLGRGGVGSTVGLDPGMAAGHGPVDDVPAGSSLPGVALAKGLDQQQASELRGQNTDIKLDPSVMIKVELFKSVPAK